MIMAESVEELLHDANQKDESEGAIGSDRPYEHRKQSEEDGIDQNCRAAIAVTRFRGDVLQPRIKPETPFYLRSAEDAHNLVSGIAS